jgi:hypothetical protein
MNRIPIIYILSNGRSGSTLLELLLNSSPAIFTLGEAQNLPWCLHYDRLCGCGERIRACEFWSPTLENIPLDVHDYPINYFRLNGSGKVIRWHLLVDVLSGKISKQWQEAARTYAGYNAEYFQSIHATLRNHGNITVRWLVDSSKDPYRLLWLSQSDLFDIRVIHLTKSPHAFVYSMIWPYLPNAFSKATRMIGRWVIENAIMSRLTQSAFALPNTLHLRYEDLAQTPQQAVDRISAWLNLESADNISLDFRQSKNHGVSGNHMRWENNPIRLDEKWKTSLPVRYRIYVSATTRLFARRYGY